MMLELWNIEIQPDQLAACVQDAVAGLSTGELSFMEIEWWDRPAEMYLYPKGIEELQGTPGDSLRGVAFGSKLEIRWRKANDKLHLVITSEISLSNIGKADSKYAWKKVDPVSTGWDGKTKGERRLLLWGTDLNSDQAWSELRIGRPLAYPVIPEEDGKVNAVELKIVEYMNSAGQVVLTRRAGMRARRAKAKLEQVREV